LNSRGYMKLDDLCELFYISRNTISTDLKKVDYILHIHHLTLERRPNYGLIIKGSEFDKRMCIANSLIKRNDFMNDDGKKTQKLEMIGSIILDVIHKYDLHISEVSLEDLVSHVFIAIERAEQDFPVTIDNEKIKKQVKNEVAQATRDIVICIHYALQI
ncbi:transcription antiterminator BglG, partial [Escherichia coli]|nr:transcription antiterminator BglG [Escherichia coli]